MKKYIHFFLLQYDIKHSRNSTLDKCMLYDFYFVLYQIDFNANIIIIYYIINYFAAPQPIGIQKMPVTDACLRCICEGVGQCRPDTKCEGEVCGMFGITWAYWADSGKPVVSGSKPSDSDGKISD